MCLSTGHVSQACVSSASGFAKDLSRSAEQFHQLLLGHLSPEGSERFDLVGHPVALHHRPRNRAAPAHPNRRSVRRCCSCAILCSQGPHPTSSPIKVRSAWQLQNKGLGLPSGGQCAAPVGRPHGDYQAQSLPPLRGLRRTSRVWPRQVRDPLSGHCSPERTDWFDLAGHRVALRHRSAVSSRARPPEPRKIAPMSIVRYPHAQGPHPTS